MNIAELEAKFAELDELWLRCPSELDVTVDHTSHSIVARKKKYDYTRSVDGAQAGGICEAYEDSLSVSGSFDVRRISGQMRSPFEEFEPVMEIDLDGVEISDEFVARRMTLNLDPERAGRLADVKLRGFGSTGVYEVVEDYSYDIDYASIGRRPEAGARSTSHLCTITVKKGFQFDRATIPRMFWVLISKDDLSNVAPLYHDLLYRFTDVLPRQWVTPYTTFTRKEADHLFFNMMEVSGVTLWRLHVAYQIVCYFSSFAWRKAR